MKYTVEKLGDDLMVEIGDVVYDWDLAHDYFRSDNPTCLDDEYPDAFSDWICDEFPNYVDDGVFDKQIDEFLLEKLKKEGTKAWAGKNAQEWVNIIRNK